MKTDKKRNNELIMIADQVLNETKELHIDGNNDDKEKKSGYINPSYNGQIAALGVMIAMIGLKPALCIYYQDNDKTNVSRKKIISVLAKMISKDRYGQSFANAEELYIHIIRESDTTRIKKEILECLTALKQVVRTYLKD